MAVDALTSAEQRDDIWVRTALPAEVARGRRANDDAILGDIFEESASEPPGFALELAGGGLGNYCVGVYRAAG